MHDTSSANVRNGKLSLRTFVVFGIVLLGAVGSTWLITENYYDDSKYTDVAFLRLDSSLDQARKIITKYNEQEYLIMKINTRDIVLKEKVAIWSPKMDSTILIANRITNYFESQKFNLKNASHSSLSSYEKFTDSLKIYKHLLESVIPIEKRLSFDSTFLDNYFSAFETKNSFNKLSRNAKITELSKLEYDALVATNIIADFINQQLNYIHEDYSYFNVLIGQNTNSLLLGDTLEISAGLGEYSSSARPHIIIDGKEQPLNSFGGVTYKKKILSNKSGSLPIIVSFKDPNTGETVTKSTTITYTVIQLPKN